MTKLVVVVYGPSVWGLLLLAALLCGRQEEGGGVTIEEEI